MFRRSNYNFIKFILDHLNNEIKLEWLKENKEHKNVIRAIIDNNSLSLGEKEQILQSI